jgi:hypothetical protein
MKTFEVALFRYLNGGWLTTWHRDAGNETRSEHYGYTRVSEWVTVDFPLRDPAEVEDEAVKKLTAERDAAAAKLATAEAKLAAVKS